MKIILKFLVVLYVALPGAINALEVGKWSFEKTEEYCYIGSLAKETDPDTSSDSFLLER